MNENNDDNKTDDRIITKGDGGKLLFFVASFVLLCVFAAVLGYFMLMR